MFCLLVPFFPAFDQKYGFISQWFLYLQAVSIGELKHTFNPCVWHKMSWNFIQYFFFCFILFCFCIQKQKWYNFCVDISCARRWLLPWSMFILWLTTFNLKHHTYITTYTHTQHELWLLLFDYDNSQRKAKRESEEKEKKKRTRWLRLSSTPTHHVKHCVVMKKKKYIQMCDWQWK